MPHDDEKPIQPVSGKVVPRFAGPSTFARLPELRDVARCDVAILGIPFLVHEPTPCPRGRLCILGLFPQLRDSLPELRRIRSQVVLLAPVAAVLRHEAPTVPETIPFSGATPASEVKRSSTPRIQGLTVPTPDVI